MQILISDPSTKTGADVAAAYDNGYQAGYAQYPLQNPPSGKTEIIIGNSLEVPLPLNLFSSGNILPENQVGTIEVSVGSTMVLDLSQYPSMTHFTVNPPAGSYMFVNLWSIDEGETYGSSASIYPINNGGYFGAIPIANFTKAVYFLRVIPE